MSSLASRIFLVIIIQWSIRTPPRSGGEFMKLGTITQDDSIERETVNHSEGKQGGGQDRGGRK